MEPIHLIIPVHIMDREGDIRLGGLRVPLEHLGLLPTAEPLDPLQGDAPCAALKEKRRLAHGRIDHVNGSCKAISLSFEPTCVSTANLNLLTFLHL